MTETGAIMGTAAYLSPEQAQGHAVGASSDLYSIGIVLYEMLTGRVPFDAESAVTIALKQVSEAPVPPRALNPAVSPELEDVVLRALQKDPARRFADADAFIAALEAVRDLPARNDVPQRTGSFTGVYPALSEYDDEAYAAEEAHRSWKRGVIALLVLLALAAIGVGAYLLLRPATQPVPNVVGLQGDVAAARLNNDGFEVSIQPVRSADRPDGEVIRQRPDPHARADRGSTVTIFVSSGPGQAEVPDVTGFKQADAERAIRRRGFRVTVQRTFSDSVPAGLVIETRPSARSQLELRRVVSLVVSRGPREVDVPGVKGQQRDDAQAQLSDLGLKVAFVEREDGSVDPGTVLDQSPSAGTKLAKGKTVTLTVAKAPTTATVPDVVGQTTNDAFDAITQAGFTPNQTAKPVTQQRLDGKVIKSRPKAGSVRKKGSTVTLVIGQYQPPATATPTPTPTPSATPTSTP